MINISFDKIFGMLFFTLNNIDNRLLEQQMLWKAYIRAKAFFIICQIKIIDLKKFANIDLDKNKTIFIVYMIFFFFFDDNHKN